MKKQLHSDQHLRHGMFQHGITLPGALKKILNYPRTIGGLLFFILYYPIIFASQLVDIDYGLIRQRIENWGSYRDYFTKPFEVYDVQPVRDLFFYLIIQLEGLTSLQLFGFFHCLTYFLASLVFLKILERLDQVKGIKWYLWALFLSHPVAAWVLYWPTALKHTLALLFIVLASLYALKEYQGEKEHYSFLKIFIYYFLSILCQPITILWPTALLLLLILQTHKIPSKYLSALVTLHLTMIVFLGLNYFYYQEVYPLQTYANKLPKYHPAPLGTIIFTYSRSLLQLLAPLKFSVSYSPNSLFNLFGLPLFMIFIWLTSLKVRKKHIASLLTVTLFPLVIVYSKPTNIFINDTYIIHALSGFILTFGFLLSSLKNTKKKIFIILTLLFVAKSAYEVRIVISPQKIFQSSYLREPTCKTILFYANELIKRSQIKEFRKIANVALSNKCLVFGSNANVITGRIFVLALYLNDLINDKSKILEELNQNDFIIAFLTKLSKADSLSEVSRIEEQFIIGHDRKRNYYIGIMERLLDQKRIIVSEP